MLYRVFDKQLGKYHTQEDFAENINEATLFSKEQAENLCATFSGCVMRPEVDEINTAMFNNTPPFYPPVPETVSQTDLRAEWNATFNSALQGMLANKHITVSDQDRKTSAAEAIRYRASISAKFADAAAEIRAKKFGG